MKTKRATRVGGMSLVGCLVAALVLVESSQVGPSTRIIGGEEAEPGELPFVVALRSDREDSLCGGSIIDEWHILTAAHCVGAGNGTSPRKATLYARLGCRDRFDCAEYAIAQAKIHPDYKLSRSDSGSDIALLRTATPIEFNETICAIELPEETDSHYEGEQLTVAGWGLTGSEDQSESVLRKVTMTAISIEECKKNYKWVDGSVICTRSIDKNVCFGDSGGPLVRHHPDGSRTLVGIVSSGDANCLPETGSVHTKVASYLDWIEDQIHLWEHPMD